MAEQEDIQVTDMMIGNAPVPTIPDVFFCEQILFRQVVLRPIGSHALLIAPVARQGETMEAINDIALRRIQFRCREMAAIEMGKLISGKLPSQMAGHLMRT